MNLESKTILGFPTKIKLMILEEALKQNNFPMFLELSKILLDAPLNEGGVETELIDQIYQKYAQNTVTTLRCNNGLKRD